MASKLNIPPIQKQHKIPEVYLKTFAIDKTKAQKKICVLFKGDSFTRKKNVKSFNRHENFFDIKSDNPEVIRLFENINGLLETHYPKIIGELEQNHSLSDKHISYLMQFAANLLSRSESWRERIMFLLESDVKSNFIKHMISHTFESEHELEDIENSNLFKNLNAQPAEELINKILILFSQHLLERLFHFEIVFLKAHDDKGWFTSDNPVVIHKETQEIEILPVDSVLYFPLTPDYLAFLHYKDSTDNTNPFRQHESNKVHELNDEEMDFVTKKILDNSGLYVICPYDFKWRK